MEKLTDILKKLVTDNPNSYARMISSAKYKDLRHAIDMAVPALSDSVYTIKTKIWWIINGIKEFPVCKTCGKPMLGHNISRLSIGYPDYCCRSCMYSSGSYSESIRDSFRHRYGVDNAFQLDSVKAIIRSKIDAIKTKRAASRKKNSKRCEYAIRAANALIAYEKYGRAAFDAFKGYDFPLHTVSDESALREMQNLINVQNKDQTPSGLIRFFHKSMYSCRRRGMVSPAEYWNAFKNEENFENGEWMDFYINRFTYAETKPAVHFRETGIMPPQTILAGFTITHRADRVSYFKPMLAKRLASKYLDGFSEVFCPFNGFSGIMLGTAYGLGKKFIGRDLNATEISESKLMVDYLTSLGYHADIDLSVSDVFEGEGEYESLFCCPPYQDIEQWNFDSSGKCVDKSLSCDDWIDICLRKFKCKRYLFVVDDRSTVKYKNNVVEKIKNRSHFGSNFEYVVLIENNDVQ